MLTVRKVVGVKRKGTLWMMGQQRRVEAEAIQWEHLISIQSFPCLLSANPTAERHRNLFHMRSVGVRLQYRTGL